MYTPCTGELVPTSSCIILYTFSLRLITENKIKILIFIFSDRPKLQTLCQNRHSQKAVLHREERNKTWHLLF